MIFCVCYDLNKPGQDYSPLLEAIKTYGTWWHHLDSTWFIESSKNASEIRDHLKSYIDTNDELLVFPVGEDWAGWGFDKKAYDWLNNNWD